MEPLRVGLIGCGSISRVHLKGFSAHPELGRIVALCDVEESRARSRAEEFGLEVPVYTDAQGMLEQADIQGVDICLPIMAHEEVAVAAALAGKHILIEKPLTNTLQQAKRVVAAAEKAGVTLMVAHNQRFRRRHMMMKELVEAGKIGRIVSARADINQNIEAILPKGHWHYYHRGALISIGVHMLDTLRYLAGNVRRVSGFFATEMMPMVGEAGVTGEEADDLAVAGLEFDNGALGTLLASYCAKAHPWHDAIVLHGTKGCLHTVGGLHLIGEVEQRDPHLSRIEADNGETSDSELVQSYVGEVEHFLRCVAEGAEPICSGRDNLLTMAAIEAIYLSGATRQAVDVRALLHGGDE
jgi:predicted dehydrogenase